MSGGFSRTELALALSPHLAHHVRLIPFPYYYSFLQNISVLMTRIEYPNLRRDDQNKAMSLRRER